MAQQRKRQNNRQKNGLNGRPRQNNNPLNRLDMDMINQTLRNMNIIHAPPPPPKKRVLIFMSRANAANITPEWKQSFEDNTNTTLIFRSLNFENNGIIAPIANVDIVLLDFTGLDFDEPNGEFLSDDYFVKFTNDCRTLVNFINNVKRMYVNKPVHILVTKTDPHYKRGCLYMNIVPGTSPIWYAPAEEPNQNANRDESRMMRCIKTALRSYQRPLNNAHVFDM